MYMLIFFLKISFINKDLALMGFYLITSLATFSESNLNRIGIRHKIVMNDI